MATTSKRLAETLVVFDTETTGLSPERDAVVELAALRFSLHQPTPASVFETLIHPGRGIPRAVTEIHGITDQMVAKAPPMATVLPLFVDFVEREPAILVAHNARFDIGFLLHAARRTGLRLPDWLAVDSVALARRWFPGMPSYSLGRLARSLRLRADGRHRALADSELVRKLVLAAAKKNAAKQLIQLLGGIEPAPLTAFLAASSRQRRHSFSQGTPDESDHSDGLRGPENEPVRILRSAIEHRHRLQIIYQGGTKGPIPRPISPRSIHYQGGNAYLLAHCHLDHREKQFLIDRILTIVPAAPSPSRRSANRER